MRHRDGRYSLLFEEYINEGPLIISPSMTFEVPVRVLSGLMSLGYSIGAIIKRANEDGEKLVQLILDVSA